MVRILAIKRFLMGLNWLTCVNCQDRQNHRILIIPALSFPTPLFTTFIFEPQRVRTREKKASATNLFKTQPILQALQPVNRHPIQLMSLRSNSKFSARESPLAIRRAGRNGKVVERELGQLWETRPLGFQPGQRISHTFRKQTYEQISDSSQKSVCRLQLSRKTAVNSGFRGPRKSDGLMITKGIPLYNPGPLNPYKSIKEG
jgi:hypothetical protein